MKEHVGWVTLNGEPVKNIEATISREISVHDRETFSDPDSVMTIEIGSDSQQTKQHTVFVSVIVARKPSKGARVFYRMDKVPRIGSLRKRLMDEAWRSLDVAWSLMDHGIGPGFISIHVDANTNPVERSAQYAQELAGLIVGQGFSVRLKPDGWAASRAADFALKKRVLVG